MPVKDKIKIIKSRPGIKDKLIHHTEELEDGIIKVKTPRREYILSVGDITANQAIEKVREKHLTFTEFEYKTIRYKKTGKKGEFIKRIDPPEKIEQRWQKKKDHIRELSDNVGRLKNHITRDLKSDHEKEFLTALIIAIMLRTGERIGNADSATYVKTSKDDKRKRAFGVSVFLKKHVSIIGNKVHLSYIGKKGVAQDKSFSDEKIAKALKRAIKNSPSPFIFTTSKGQQINDDIANKYLQPFNISCKAVRGYSANKWVLDKLKVTTPEDTGKKRKKQLGIILKMVAEKVGHGPSVLKNQYLMPEVITYWVDKGEVFDIKEAGYVMKTGGKINSENEVLSNQKEIKKKEPKTLTAFLAPNGKKSNLTLEQYKLVRTPEFMKWFGDWINDPDNASKVLDENEEPMVCYHGSDYKINIFDIRKQNEGFHGKGFYFATDDLEYGKNIYKSFLNIRKPFNINASYSIGEIKNILGGKYKEIEPKINEELQYSIDNKIGGFIFYSFARNEALKKSGYDGIIQSNIRVAFEPQQIKLADGTNTAFDGSNPDIRYENGGISNHYREIGFTSVGQKKKSTRPEKKWMVLAKKGDKYRIVHGGQKGMKDFSQHHDKERQKRFWNRMGGFDSEKANDPFSPLYWHKKFGTWEDGGELMDKGGNIDSKEFKKWFGNSTAVDDKGNPLKLYHGTDADTFTIFDSNKTSANVSKFGFFFTDDNEFAKMFGEKVIEVYVSIQNPFVISQDQWNNIRVGHAKDEGYFAGWRKRLIDQGYDGLVAEESFEEFAGRKMRNPKIFVAFYPEQIKLTDNKNFDAKNPDIRYENGGNLTNSDDFAESKKIRNFVVNPTKDEIKNVISGKGGTGHESQIRAAASYLRRSEKPGSMVKGSKQYKEQEAERLRLYISENNLWISNPDPSRFLNEGCEQKIYILDRENVVKVNDAISFAIWEDYFNNLLLHNYFFADTQYNLLGFIENDGRLFAIVKQPYIKSNQKTNLDQVRQFMADNGFVNTKDENYENTELGLILEDLHSENVLTKDGVLYFIDTVFYMTDKIHSLGGSVQIPSPIFSKGDVLDLKGYIPSKIYDVNWIDSGTSPYGGYLYQLKPADETGPKLKNRKEREEWEKSGLYLYEWELPLMLKSTNTGIDYIKSYRKYLDKPHDNFPFTYQQFIRSINESLYFHQHPEFVNYQVLVPFYFNYKVDSDVNNLSKGGEISSDLNGLAFKKMSNNLFLVTSDTQEKLAKLFVRPNSYLDCREFKGKIFTLSEFSNWYAKEKGAFTYYQDYKGFNIPDYVIDVFLSGDFDPLSDEEKWLMDNLLFSAPKKPYYVIGYVHVPGEEETRYHELAHALYYLSATYKNEVNDVIEKFWKEISPEALATIQGFLTKLQYDRSIWNDEMNAYLIADKDYLIDEKAWSDEFDKYRKTLGKIFEINYFKTFDKEFENGLDERHAAGGLIQKGQGAVTKYYDKLIDAIVTIKEEIADTGPSKESMLKDMLLQAQDKLEQLVMHVPSLLHQAQSLHLLHYENGGKLNEVAQKQIDDYIKEGIFINESDRPAVGSLPISRFNGPDADIFPNQLSVDRKGVEKWRKRIQAGERPYVLIDHVDYLGENRVKDAHHRLKAYEDLGFTDIPVIDVNGRILNVEGMASGGIVDQDYKKWKRKNVTLRGMKEVGEENNAGAMLGRGLYTAHLSNKTLSKEYGTVHFVVNARPRNPLKVDSLNEWQIWFQNLAYRRLGFRNLTEFNKATTIENEIQKLGYDGIEIVGREIVNFTPGNDVKYFRTEDELKDYYDKNITRKESGGSISIIKQREILAAGGVIKYREGMVRKKYLGAGKWTSRKP